MGRSHDTPAAIREPRLDLLEVCWRVAGPTQKVIECGIYRTDVGLEVRAGYGADDLIRSQFAIDVDLAREIGSTWKIAALDKGFTELPTPESESSLR